MTVLCPECGARSAVIDTRSTDGTLKRRRECKPCRVRWNTWELPIPCVARSAEKPLRAAQATIARLRLSLKEAQAKADPTSTRINGAPPRKKHAQRSYFL
jgi:transcriptional regulator NrdR family protein